mgnify:FL=1
MSASTFAERIVLFVVAALIADADRRSFLIPDRYLVAGTTLVLLCKLFAVATSGSAVPLIAAVVGGLATLILFVLVRVVVRGTLGFGDVKYLAFLGLCLGPALLYVALLFAVVSVFVTVPFRRRRLIPFGVNLSLGAVLAVEWDLLQQNLSVGVGGMPA